MKPIVTLLAIFTSLGAFSQATMNIYENNGSVLNIPLTSIDSITYTLGSNGTLATLITLPVDSITSGSAASGGDITSSGGTTVTNRGVCWSTSPNPTTANSITSNGSGTGIFTSDLTGLQAGTTYYVCAYATNSAGTAYGPPQTFTTAPNTTPTVTTNAITNITATTATGGGNIISNGGPAVTARGVCWSTSIDPTTADSASSNGSGYGDFTSNMTGLTANTIYYVRAYATDSVGTVYGNQVNFTTPYQACGTITDTDGNVYNTVTIGTQCWMQQNLKTTHFRDGTAISEVEDTAAWAADTIAPAWCYYAANPANNSNYGKLYNWYVISDPRNVCPAGWHVPSDSEYTVLDNYLGGTSVSGGHMKEVSILWTSQNMADNSSNFSALPGGDRFNSGTFINIGNDSYFWSSTSEAKGLAWFRSINYSQTIDDRFYNNEGNGYSVRCVGN